MNPRLTRRKFSKVFVLNLINKFISVFISETKHYSSADLSKNFQTHRIVINFTESSMKLYNNETNIAFKVDKASETLNSTLNTCEHSLRFNHTFHHKSNNTKDICSAIYSFYCDINDCVQKAVQKPII